jgi:hypothetical protein
LQDDTKLQLAEKTVATSAEPTPAIVFSSGENAVVVVDPAVAPSGTELAIFSDSGELVGRTVITSSGAVVTVPNTAGGWTLHLQGSPSANGPSQVFQVLP